MVPRTGRLGPGTVEKSCLVGRVKIHRARVIRKEGKKYKEEHVLKTTKYGSGGSVMLWDCFCAGSFGPLATLNGRVNQDKYIKCFAEVYVFWMVDLMEKEQKSFILQDDEASCHTAGKPSACSKAD